VGLQDYLAGAQTEGRQAAERIAEAAKQAGLASEILMVENAKASHGIVEAASQCGADLIAMGSHGRSGLAKVVLGSVAAEVLAQSSVPVLIFK
jgi:nucleotide-binding universal stress UspA family protein